MSKQGFEAGHYNIVSDLWITDHISNSAECFQSLVLLLRMDNSLVGEAAEPIRTFVDGTKVGNEICGRTNERC